MSGPSSNSSVICSPWSTNSPASLPTGPAAHPAGVRPAAARGRRASTQWPQPHSLRLR